MPILSNNKWWSTHWGAIILVYFIGRVSINIHIKSLILQSLILMFFLYTIYIYIYQRRRKKKLLSIAHIYLHIHLLMIYSQHTAMTCYVPDDLVQDQPSTMNSDVHFPNEVQQNMFPVIAQWSLGSIQETNRSIINLAYLVGSWDQNLGISVSWVRAAGCNGNSLWLPPII